MLDDETPVPGILEQMKSLERWRIGSGLTDERTPIQGGGLDARIPVLRLPALLPVRGVVGAARHGALARDAHRKARTAECLRPRVLACPRGAVRLSRRGAPGVPAHRRSELDGPASAHGVAPGRPARALDPRPDCGRGVGMALAPVGGVDRPLLPRRPRRLRAARGRRRQELAQPRGDRDDRRVRRGQRAVPSGSRRGRVRGVGLRAAHRPCRRDHDDLRDRRAHRARVHAKLAGRARQRGFAGGVRASRRACACAHPARPDGVGRDPQCAGDRISAARVGHRAGRAAHAMARTGYRPRTPALDSARRICVRAARHAGRGRGDPVARHPGTRPGAASVDGGRNRDHDACRDDPRDARPQRAGADGGSGDGGTLSAGRRLGAREARRRRAPGARDGVVDARGPPVVLRLCRVRAALRTAADRRGAAVTVSGEDDNGVHGLGVVACDVPAITCEVDHRVRRLGPWSSDKRGSSGAGLSVRPAINKMAIARLPSYVYFACIESTKGNRPWPC